MAVASANNPGTKPTSSVKSKALKRFLVLYVSTYAAILVGTVIGFFFHDLIWLGVGIAALGAIACYAVIGVTWSQDSKRDPEDRIRGAHLFARYNVNFVVLLLVATLWTGLAALHLGQVILGS